MKMKRAVFMVAILATLILALFNTQAWTQGSPVSFHWQLMVADDVIGSFETCSGIGSKSEIATYSQGGMNTIKRPGRVNFFDVILKRKFTGDDKVWKWRQDVVNQEGIIKKDLTISLMDQENNIVVQWIFMSGWPSMLEVSTDEIPIETLVITHDGVLWQ